MSTSILYHHHQYGKNPITKFFVGIFLLILAVSVQNVKPDDFGCESDCALDNVLQNLLVPKEYSSIQAQALRRYLLRILNDEALNENIEMPDYDLLSQSNYKRSIATLAKNGQLPTLQSPEETETDPDEEKRNIASLARTGGMSRYLKRSLESLARGGYLSGKRNIGSLARNGYLKRDVDDYLEDMYQKRYIGALARQYNFPSGKRNLGSLARSGQMIRYNRNPDDFYAEAEKRNLQSLMKSGGVLGGKRNLASLVRGQNMPFYNRYDMFKRNIGAIARDWALPNHSTSWDKNSDDKRNVAALLRQDSYLNRNIAMDAQPTAEVGDEIQTEEKRNLASLKAQATSNYITYGNRNVKRSVIEEHDHAESNAEADKDENKDHSRSKRQADDFFEGNSEEYPVPVMQNSNSVDYEDLINALTGRYPLNEKRFLGNIPLSRMAELGKLSMMGQSATSNTTPTSPTYRRRQYLLSRTNSADNE